MNPKLIPLGVVLVCLSMFVGFEIGNGESANKLADAEAAEIDARSQLSALQSQTRPSPKVKDDSEYWKNLYYGEQTTVANLQSQIGASTVDQKQQWTTAAAFGGCLVALQQFRGPAVFDNFTEPATYGDLAHDEEICEGRLKASQATLAQGFQNGVRVPQQPPPPQIDWVKAIEILRLLLH